MSFYLLHLPYNVLCNNTYQERQRDWPYEALATERIRNDSIWCQIQPRRTSGKDELESEFYLVSQR